MFVLNTGVLVLIDIIHRFSNWSINQNDSGTLMLRDLMIIIDKFLLTIQNKSTTHALMNVKLTRVAFVISDNLSVNEILQASSSDITLIILRGRRTLPAPPPL